MSAEVAKKNELTAETKRIAKSIIEKGKEEGGKILSGILADNAPLGVAVVNELVEIVKESVQGKERNQAAFIAICDKVIDSCNNALVNGKIEEEERLLIQKRVDELVTIANESNIKYQKDKKHIALAGIGGITLLGVIGIIASAFTKTRAK